MTIAMGPEPFTAAEIIRVTLGATLAHAAPRLRLA